MGLRRICWWNVPAYLAGLGAVIFFAGIGVMMMHFAIFIDDTAPLVVRIACFGGGVALFVTPIWGAAWALRDAVRDWER